MDGSAPFVTSNMSEQEAFAELQKHFREDRLVDFIDAFINKIQKRYEEYQKIYYVLPYSERIKRGFRAINAEEYQQYKHLLNH